MFDSSHDQLGYTIKKLLFDFMSYDCMESMQRDIATLPLKWLRWLATNHPDNRCRKLFLRESNVSIGHGTVINSGFIVSDDYKPLLTIGERVAISPNVTIICSSYPNNSRLLELRGFCDKYTKELPVAIGNDTWVGTGVIILPGVRIGSGTVISAGSIVRRNVPDGVIVKDDIWKTIEDT